jgi:hypothetical protein
MDGQTDMTKLTVAFCSFGNVLDNAVVITVITDVNMWRPPVLICRRGTTF